MTKVFVGHDWAEAHHNVLLEDESGRRLAGGRLPEGVEGVRRFHELVGAHTDDPAEVTIATETDRGLFVGALVAAGYRVLAVNASVAVTALPLSCTCGLLDSRSQHYES